ncbi:MAG: hypothetical protein IKS65_04115 [Bacteroidales bacterium]|nr:hypothetical protein [Bacteroidales bacterium]
MSTNIEKSNIFNDDERQYLQMMQDNIARMSSNSANCKNWLVMIVVALFAVSCSLGDIKWWLLLTLFPIFLFWYLDAFYLRLERGFRNRQREFLNTCFTDCKPHHYKCALYNFRPYTIDREVTQEEIKLGYVSTSGCWKSKSIRPFYITVLVVVLIIVMVLNIS